MKTLILLCLVISSAQSFAMGSKRPRNPGGSSTPSQNPLPTVPVPTIDFGQDLNADEYLNASSVVGPSVDAFKKLSELTKIRSIVNDDTADKCFDDNEPHDQFADQISYYSQKMIKDIPAMVGAIGSYYGTSESDSNYFPTSLIRHPLCQVSSSSLSQTIKNVPSQSTIDKMNQFANAVNSLRTDVISGDQTAKAELLSLWSSILFLPGLL